MKQSRLAVLATVPVLAVLAATPGRADDAYVCDGGRLVYARPETLDKLKQTDPCIAGYFKFSATPVQAAPTGPAELVAPQSAPGALKPRPTPGKSAAARVVAPKAPAAAAGTDYRNVRVINAERSDGVFRHGR